MFLFTTPTSSTPQRDAASTPVVDAIRYGAERSGTGFDYLLKTAQRESALDPSATTKASSATGLFQFIEQTWLGLVKSDGDKHGLGAYAAAIGQREGGTYSVDDPNLRRQILALRNDPKVASVMAGILARQNRDALGAGLGREPSEADLYVAHVLGAKGAVDLIGAARNAPTRAVAGDFPEAAAANRPIFFDRSGRARGAGEIYAILAAGHEAARPLAGPIPAGTAASPDPAAIPVSGPALYNLFNTSGRRGPISDVVAKLWTTGARRSVVETTKAAAYFPRSGEPALAEAPVASDAAVNSPALAPALAPAASGGAVPLPPARPADGDAQPATPVAAAVQPPKRAPRTRRPLDLSSFMQRRSSS